MAHKSVLVESMPYAENHNQPFPDDYADYCPLGNCPEHGLEGYGTQPLHYNTGYDNGVADRFLCGRVDIEQVF